MSAYAKSVQQPPLAPSSGPCFGIEPADEASAHLSTCGGDEAEAQEAAGDDELCFADFPSPAAVRPVSAEENRQGQQEDMDGQVKSFLGRLPASEQGQIVDRLLRRIAEGQPLSARRISDRIDESCEFLARFLQFCSDVRVVEDVLRSVSTSIGKNMNSEEAMVSEFLASRRQHRLKPVRIIGPWEEHFARGTADRPSQRYFYNSETQKTQWDPPEDWPEAHDAPSGVAN